MSNSNDQELPLVQHLIELRNRLLKALLVIGVVCACLLPFASEIYQFVSAPLQAYLPDNNSMIATDVASPFLTPFKLTLFTAFIVSVPFVLYQIWAFIAPGLYRHEKRLALPILASSVMLFYLGMAFAYFVVFPLIFGFFTSVGPANVAIMTDISRYLDFVLKIFFAFGVAFEIPIATILLILAGVISADGMARKRPYVVVGCFIIGMLLTPPDIISQTLLALPMWVLFEAGIFFGRILQKKRENPTSPS
ncbi:twin-arginine translocase subunit TatC [Gilvimarinus agarilyticus]|uniref:twin-arginine translocase subunit TatC n=1 Tax=unclassified Gilvimarinus TaxID=2642066 RepID=UPI001C0A20A8|nr:MULTISPECIES: twin-arginine translocase subunit TatC [unclassified Gilvimarinus]MBU2885569.1 twin-arginine translocase subunit TatC [Gilvimarinus agarilyticus]MDO6570436.1 twin-arginine translocase subunit TatC [Gilvimarinus sp. 2_MG-2023]MDO6746488.1 twin-arginine translocase subunit TatC [Gilvimarinus sp. 1_MG-2023]